MPISIITLALAKSAAKKIAQEILTAGGTLDSISVDTNNVLTFLWTPADTGVQQTINAGTITVEDGETPYFQVTADNKLQYHYDTKTPTTWETLVDFQVLLSDYYLKLETYNQTEIDDKLNLKVDKQQSNTDAGKVLTIDSTGLVIPTELPDNSVHVKGAISGSGAVDDELDVIVSQDADNALIRSSTDNGLFVAKSDSGTLVTDGTLHGSGVDADKLGVTMSLDTGNTLTTGTDGGLFVATVDAGSLLSSDPNNALTLDDNGQLMLDTTTVIIGGGEI